MHGLQPRALVAGKKPRARVARKQPRALRESIANLLIDVCHDVVIEPHLQPLQGEAFALKSVTTYDDARLDIEANGLWESKFNQTYFEFSTC